jgi:phosphatidylserine/phosphatidylglycerophosphate/cardiolipin synthase-like enzyme
MHARAIRTSALVCGLTMATAFVAYPAHAASDPYSAFVFSTSSATEPTIYNFIEQATSSLDMTMYELSDTTVENDLISLEKSGVDVRVILDQAEKSTNDAAYTSSRTAASASCGPPPPSPTPTRRRSRSTTTSR